MKKLVIFLLLATVGCALLLSGSPKMTGITTLAILPFENPLFMYKDLGWKSFEKLQTELTKYTLPFRYLDRFALGPVLSETWLGGDTEITKEQAIAFGKKLFVDAIFIGKIVECKIDDPIEKDDYYDRERQKWHYLVFKNSSLKYSVRIYNVNNGKLLWVYSGTTSAQAKSDFFAGSTYTIESNDTMTDRMLKSMSEEIAAKLAATK
jgi:hypothetical protein